MNNTQEMEDEISLIDIIRVLLKRKKLIIGGTLICFTGALLFAFLKPSPPKVYQSSLIIQVGKITGGSIEPQKSTLIEPQKSTLIEPINVVKSKLENDYLVALGLGDDNVKISVGERGDSILVLRGESSPPNLAKTALEGLKVKLLNDHDKMIKTHRDPYIAKKENDIAKKENDIAKKENDIAKKEKKPNIFSRKIEALKMSNKVINKELLSVSSSKRDREGNPSLILEAQMQLTANALQIADLEWALMQYKETLKEDKETLKKDKETLKKDKKGGNGLTQGTKILQEPTTIEMPAPASKKKLILTLGVVLGMMVSIFLAFFMEFIENNKNQWKKLKG